MATKTKDPYIAFLEGELKKKSAKPTKRKKVKRKTTAKRKTVKRKTTAKKTYTRRKPTKIAPTKKQDSIQSFFDAIDDKGDRLQKNISKIAILGESKIKNLNPKKRIIAFKNERERGKLLELKTKLATQIAETKRKNEEKKELALQKKELDSLRKEAKLLKAEDTRQRAISGLAEYRKKKKAPSKISRLKKFSFRFKR